MIQLIREYIDVFAWSYEDMLGLNPQMAMHRLNIDLTTKPVKQPQRCLLPEIIRFIESEVKKLINTRFIMEEQDADWLDNIVLVAKKNENIWICIDFRDFNKVCPKDEFPLPITDITINDTCGYERMSFMNGVSWYTQIKMYSDDEKHTSFKTLLWYTAIRWCPAD